MQDIERNLPPCRICKTPADTEEFPYPIDRGGTWWRMGCANPFCTASVIGESADDAVEKWNRDCRGYGMGEVDVSFWMPIPVR